MPLPVRHRTYIAPANIKRRGNPYFASRRSDKIGIFGMKNVLAKIPARGWFWIFAFLAVCAALVWLLFFSSVFTVKYVEVRGAQLSSAGDIETMAHMQTEEKRIFFLQQDRLFVFKSEDFKSKLINDYSLENVKIIKKLPSTLIIELQEKQAAAVWLEAEQYYLVDSAADIISPSSPEELSVPIIRNNGLPKIKERKVDVDPSIISTASQIFTNFPSRFSWISVKELAVSNDARTLILASAKGPMIYFNTSEAVDPQLVRLDTLLQGDLRSRFEKLDYIDLRFGDKLYYK